MVTLTNFFNNVLAQLANADFGLLIIIDLVAFGVTVAAALVACLISRKVRAHDKRSFIYAVNAFTALTLAIFLTEFSLVQSVAASAVFWCAGYLIYGALHLFKVRKKRVVAPQGNPVPAVTVNAPVRTERPRQTAPANVEPASQSGVRLEHALSIADKLLLKNLGRGDRQELEKMKTALTVLKVKGVLSPQEGESLNEMFNALLKLMAKYDL